MWASCLKKERNYKHKAETYSEYNDFQVVLGKRLVESLDIRTCDNVLDIGCGTGEITAHIADTVGKNGLTVGVDPDEHRINVARQKHGRDRNNICFVNGDSSCNFPHHNEAFYGIVYSSLVFHWMNQEEKITFLETAFRCLKPRGKIGIVSADTNPEIFMRVPEMLPENEIESNRSPYNNAAKIDVEVMLRQAGFEIQCSVYFQYEYTFPSLEYYLTWLCASCYVDESKILLQKKEEFAREFVKDDGTIDLKHTMYRLIATKPETVC